MNMLILAATLLAATTTPASASATDDELMDGGNIRIGAKGVLAFVNACDASDDTVASAATQLAKLLMIDVRPQRGSWALPSAASAFEKADATAAVFVVRDRTLPMSLVAMESRWGVVNAEGLDDACLKRELLRVATVVLGGAASKYDPSFMRPVFSASELAKSGDAFTIDVAMMLFPSLQNHGFSQYRTMTYREACEEGLNIAPTNDVQRKIAAEYKSAK